jgi:Rad3-related DNA helicase
MSATLRPTALTMLNIDKEDRAFREWPRVFPAQYTPIYHIKNNDSVRMDSKADDERLRKWVQMIDSVIDARLDRKGLIHTVSYLRQDFLLHHSRHRDLMIANTQDPEMPTAVEAVELFKSAAAPALLVSPSFSTGWDFPGVTCEYQIIAKVPFPDTRNKLMRARLERSQVYGNWLTMQDLVQACGRGTRSEKDRCEIFIVDDHISWFFYRNRNLAPRWFEIVRVSEIPPAPPKLAA